MQRVIHRGIKVVDHRLHRFRPRSGVLLQHTHHDRHQLRWRRLHGAQLRNGLVEIEHALYIEVRVIRRLSG
jgi:hypothetical protein